MEMPQIAIVGGGPAGSLCGERLARAGVAVTIYDEHLAWEKPCGGGLTHKAIVAYPFLRENPAPKKLVREIELISSMRPHSIDARTSHRHLLPRRAQWTAARARAQAGCRIVRSRVTQLDTTARRVRFAANGSSEESDFAVIATGARNALLPGTSPLQPPDLEITVGYFIPAHADAIR